MAKLYIDLSGRGGLAVKHQGDVGDATGRPQLRYLGKDGQMAQGIYNSLRNYGFMSPAGNSFTTVAEATGDDFTNEWRASIFDSVSGSFYFGENGSLLWGGDFSSSGSTTATNLRNALGAAITGTSVKITDLEIYQKNGSKRIFFAYQKSTGGDIGIFAPTSDGSITSNDNTWLSTTATGAFTLGATNDIFMRGSDNGFMYVFDGNSVHKIDGTTGGGANGTATANVIVFPTTFNIPDAIDWRGYMWIGVQTSSPAGASVTNTSSEQVVGVYVWDRQSTVVNSQDFIPMNGVKEIRRLYVTNTGELRALVISSERFVQIRKYNGATFEVIAETGIGAYPNYRDSFGFKGGLATWLGVDGRFYAHGSLAVGDPEALFMDGDVTALPTGSYTTGAILYADDNQSSTTPRQGIFFSLKDANPTVFNRIWYPNATGLTPHVGNTYTPVKFLPKMAKVNHINIFCIPTAAGAGTSATVSVYLNQSTSAYKAHTVTLDQSSKGYINIPLHKPYVNSIQLKVAWNIATTTGTDDFCPAFAEIDYTSTTVAK